MGLIIFFGTRFFLFDDVHTVHLFLFAVYRYTFFFKNYAQKVDGKTTTPGGQSISPPSGIIFHPFPPGCLALDGKKT